VTDADFLAAVDELAEPLWESEPNDPSDEHDYFREDRWAE
jgi:hypothetical protein